MKIISVTVNGKLYNKAVEDNVTLLSFLRDE